jgi:hypothetical protein
MRDIAMSNGPSVTWDGTGSAFTASTPDTVPAALLR